MIPNRKETQMWDEITKGMTIKEQWATVGKLLLGCIFGWAVVALIIIAVVVIT